MRGRIVETKPGPDGKMLAVVELEGVEGSIELPYWPELLEQWGADKLRSHLLHEAAQLVAPEPPADDPHAALIGEGESALAVHDYPEPSNELAPWVEHDAAERAKMATK